ncbi:hypothetical protein GCM10023149_35070 [Mucilaginibacter gynuensis]|uniref:Thioredoxin-like protein n=1 Tax=Mucilaginibacter gynuensis TaxID=1302236 RepID=A0ABP8GUE7_9SPHI
MKYVYIVLMALVVAGCNRSARIEIDGTAKNLPNGVFGIEDVAGKPVYGNNVANGKFAVNEILEYPGYYAMKLSDGGNSKEKPTLHEIYLENGKYTIAIDGSNLAAYPTITSPSKIQQELSAYYKLVDEISTEGNKQINMLTAVLNSDMAKTMAQDRYVEMVNELKKAQDEKTANEAKAIGKFIDANPKNVIAPHIMINLDYQTNPKYYYDIFNKLEPEVKNSEEGKQLGEKLGQLVKVLEGQPGPEIYGTDPEGKKFDPKSIQTKVVLVTFWRAGNEVSRKNHKDIIDGVLPQFSAKDVSVISIDLDTKKDWWTDAVKEDKLPWAQYSDLKGNDSQNAAVWGISQVPSYYLMSGDWKIIARNLPFESIADAIATQLKKSK